MNTITKYALLTASIALVITGNIFLCGNKNNIDKSKLLPMPGGGDQTIVREENEKDEYSLKIRRKLWYEAIHTAAPGTNWRAVEVQNMLRSNSENQFRQDPGLEVMAESFANGALQGTWSERGSLNQAGRVTACDYYKSTNRLYVLGDAGVLFRGVPDSSNWTVLNNNLTFNNRTIKVITNASGNARILGSIGLNIFYSDNNGVDFSPATGITFPVDWGGNYVKQIVSLNDANKTVYVLTHVWDDTPWAPRFWLYRSTNRGQTFTKINTFSEDDDNGLSLWVPYNSTNILYALGNQPGVGTTSTLYSISGATVSVLNTSTDLPVNVSCVFKGCKTTSTVLYALISNNSLYKSTNLGVSWTFQSSLPEDGGALGVSITNPNQVSYGYVNCYRSNSGGSSWTQVNFWGDYYSNVVEKFHADMQQIEYFKKSNGTEFGLIMNDGGIYRTDNFLVNNTNIGLKGLNISQYYDVKSEPNGNWVHCGSQDQGFQRSNTASGTNKTNLTQVISGDYGFLQLTGTNNNHLWTQYPGGEIYYYHNSHLGLSSTYSLPGSNKPLYGWILPTARFYPASNNKILIVGGDITGGSGSYLVKLVAQTAAPCNITATQFNYDFRANSNGTAGLCAVETTPLNASKIYTATEDGTFFYSSNGGTGWTKNSSFSGPAPHWLHGNAIFASRLTANLVYYAGSGYSNPAIYKSVNGGAVFTAINNGLPDCSIFDLDANATETLLFAATSAGPYVYVVADNQWYSMKGAAALCEYFSVEYLSAFNKVRFGTYGRGFWDFKITVQPAIADHNNQVKTLHSAPEFSLSLYPNPVSSITTIQFEEVVLNGNIEIYNTEGKRIRKLNVSNQTIVSIDVSAFEKGLYFVKIIGAGGSKTIKMIKQ